MRLSWWCGRAGPNDDDAKHGLLRGIARQSIKESVVGAIIVVAVAASGEHDENNERLWVRTTAASRRNIEQGKEEVAEQVDGGVPGWMDFFYRGSRLDVDGTLPAGPP